jgi:drug/metabolite transporter (DMT)-like permease
MSDSANLTHSSMAASGKEALGTDELVVGIVLTLLGAATLAFSMTIQRYALAHPKPTIPYCGLQLKKKWVWGAGLLLCTPLPAPPHAPGCVPRLTGPRGERQTAWPTSSR